MWFKESKNKIISKNIREINKLLKISMLSSREFISFCKREDHLLIIIQSYFENILIRYLILSYIITPTCKYTH